jgi:tetratricopeptide (TPR) repeat protein
MHRACRILSGLVLSSLASVAAAEDVVIIRSATDPAARIRKTGEILDHTGLELTLQTSFGTTERIPAARVVEIATAWTAEQDAARNERKSGRLTEAIAAFRDAQRIEKRAWVRRQIAAELSNVFLEAGRVAEAVETFLPVVASDPATPHYASAPIAWRASLPDAALDSRAEIWLEDQQPEAARLLGASWLLPGGQRERAIAVLEELSNSRDPRIAGLAACQLWRTKLVTAKLKEVRQWQEQLAKYPPEVQASGWYIVGEAFARLEDCETAALAYLKTPLLFHASRPVAADAVLAAAKQLEKIGRPQQAVGLYRELQRDYSHLPAAAEAQARLLKLTAADNK